MCRKSSAELVPDPIPRDLEVVKHRELRAGARPEPGFQRPCSRQLAVGSVKNLGRYAASRMACWPKRPPSTAALT